MSAPFKPEDGEALKEKALALHEFHREQLVRRARKFLLQRILDKGTATIDDVRAVVELPEGINPKCFGSVPGPLAKSGIIRAMDYVKTVRSIAHARKVTKWELGDAVKAERWLAAHSNRPQVPPPAAAAVTSLFPTSSTNAPGAATGIATPGNTENH